jgi:predicted transcriptional regulator
MAKNNRRPTFQREKDLLEISELYLRGVGQIEIAEKIGVTQATISNDLKEIQRRWVERSTRNFDEARAEELAKIDEMELEYRDAWQRSTDYVVKKKGDVVALIASDKRNPFGNDAAMKGRQWCIDRRCKLLGLDAPTRTELSTKDDKPIIIRLVNDDDD